MPKKITLITPAWKPNVWSGTGRLSYSLGQGLLESGYEVSVLTYTGEQRSRLIMDGKDGKIPVRYLSVSEGGLPSVMPLEKVKIWQSKIDEALQYPLRHTDQIILIDSFGWPPAKCTLPDVPKLAIVNMLHNCYDKFGKTGEDFLRGLLLEEERDMLKNADVVAVNNMVLVEKIKNLVGRDVNKFTMGVPTIEKALNSKTFQYNPKECQSGSAVFVAKLNKDRGLERVLRAMPDLKWLKLKVIGAVSEDSYMQRVKDLIRELDIGHRVTFLGWMNSRQVWDHYMVAEMSVIPSVFEPFGYAALDPMSAGIPTVASIANVLPELIDDGSDGMLFRNIDELRFALEEMHHMEPLRVMFSSASREKVAKKFTLQEMTRSIMSLMGDTREKNEELPEDTDCDTGRSVAHNGTAG